MGVYVDNMAASYGRMTMCHMVADSTKELLEMADKIGVNRKWIQHPGTPKEHFDVCKAKREKAISNGAIQVGPREIAAMLIKRAGK